MTPSPGHIVHYVLSQEDADQVNRRRTDGRSIVKRLASLHWPEGAQAHIGTPARAGDVLPMLIVKVNAASDVAPGVATVNGQVFLDGNDVLWVRERGQVVTDSTDKAGLWFDPRTVEQEAARFVGGTNLPAGSVVLDLPPPPAPPPVSAEDQGGVVAGASETPGA